MEMLIAGLEDVGEIRCSRDEPNDVADWEGVYIGGESDTGIDWRMIGLEGSPSCGNIRQFVVSTYRRT